MIRLVLDSLMLDPFMDKNRHNSLIAHIEQFGLNESLPVLGPQRDSLYVVIPMTIIYSLIFCTGLIGNISTCLVIRRHRSMHTATNYYLFSLAISDFLLLLTGVPQEMYFIWSKYPYIFGEYFCIGRGLLAETAANATVLTITAFTVERYMAICHPFLGQAMSKLSRAIRLIILIWILSILAAIPQAAQFGIIGHHGVEKCIVVRVIIEHSFQLSTYIFFILPMLIILILYILIGLHIHRSHLMPAKELPVKLPATRTNPTGSTIKSSHSDTILYRQSEGGGGGDSSYQQRRPPRRLRSNNSVANRRVLRMLVAVVICFFLCWAPFHAQRLIAVYGVFSLPSPIHNVTEHIVNDTDHIENDTLHLHHHHLHHHNQPPHHDNEIIYTILTYVSGVLYYLSTCINPILYNLMSHKFRQAFKTTLFSTNLNHSKSSDSRTKSKFNYPVAITSNSPHRLKPGRPQTSSAASTSGGTLDTRPTPRAIDQGKSGEGNSTQEIFPLKHFKADDVGSGRRQQRDLTALTIIKN